MRLLRSATTNNPGVVTETFSEIDIKSSPTIRRAPKDPHPKHVDNHPTLPQQKFMARMKYLSEQAEGTTDEKYEPPEEIDVEMQNPNLLLTYDHIYIQIPLKDHHG
jgi:hypothetical protein